MTVATPPTEGAGVARPSAAPLPHVPLSPAQPTTLLHLADCVEGMWERVADDSIDLTVTSIPFGALFMYSGRSEDIGNNRDGVDLRADQFGLHLRFMIAQLYRVTKPGCNVCIHVQQLLRYKIQHGYIGRRDLRGAVIDLFGAGGFEWKGEVAIEKDPQIIAQRLSLHSLQFKTGRTNARDLAPAVNDYVIVFQKPGEATPVAALRDDALNPDGWMSDADWIVWARGVWSNRDQTIKRIVDGELRHVTIPGLARLFTENLALDGFEDCMRWWLAHDWLESGVWSDIRETDVLDGWKSARERDEEKHVCPLQLEVIRRCIKLYTNPGEVVLDPFMGIGSTAVVALEQGRHSVGFELKESYHNLSERNVAKWRRQLAPAVDLFTLAAEAEAEA